MAMMTMRRDNIVGDDALQYMIQQQVDAGLGEGRAFVETNLRGLRNLRQVRNRAERGSQGATLLFCFCLALPPN